MFLWGRYQFLSLIVKETDTSTIRKYNIVLYIFQFCDTYNPLHFDSKYYTTFITVPHTTFTFIHYIYLITSVTGILQIQIFQC